MLAPAAWITLVLLITMFALLVWDRLPIWLVFIGALTVAITLRLAPAPALLKGYSNTGVVTVAALYPVAAGMYATGAISLLSERLFGLPKSIRSAQLRILLPVSFASAFLYNTPLVAMMIPAVRDLIRRTGLNGSKLFMGLSYIALIGGTMTLIGTSVNLIIAGLVSDALAKGELTGIQPIRLFDPIWIGLPATLTGLAFMTLIAPRLLPEKTTAADMNTAKRMFRSEFQIEAGAHLDGKTLEQAGLANPIGWSLDAIHRNGLTMGPKPNLKLEGGDLLTISSPGDVLPGLWTTIGLKPVYATKFSTARHEHQLVELVLSAQSPAVGHRVSELPLPDSPYQIMLVGVSRNGQAPPERLANLRLEPGDAGVVEANDAFFYENRR